MTIRTIAYDVVSYRDAEQYLEENGGAWRQGLKILPYGTGYTRVVRHYDLWICQSVIYDSPMGAMCLCKMILKHPGLYRKTKKEIIIDEMRRLSFVYHENSKQFMRVRETAQVPALSEA